MKSSFIILLLFFRIISFGQTVKNTSYLTQTGEKVLRLEIVIPVSVQEAWQLFTKDDELKKWIAPSVHIELRTGGYIVTNYDKTKPFTDSSSIKLGIINYIENELMTLKVKLNNSFSKEVQSEDGNLQEIIQFVPVQEKQTRVISSMLGWGSSEEWNKTYRFFERGNVWTFGEILRLYH